MVYEIAGLRILIENRCKYTDAFCKGYLAQDQSAPVDISAKVTNEEFYAEKELSGNFSDGYVENICLYRTICRQLPMKNRMLLHAAVLAVDGDAYAFLGRSGTGKSTHTGLWMQYLENVTIVNGDKPILEQTQDGFIAHGTPWNGKEGLGNNISVPLKGLCFLEQAKQNEIVRLTPAEAAGRIFSQILFPQDEENATKTLEMTDALVTNVPCYLLKCDISKQAMQTSYEEMTGKKYEK